MSEPEVTGGQAAETDSPGTTAAAPEGGDRGQSADPSQTTASSGPGTVNGESFFDPKSIEHSPELMQAYKQMQGKFTKSMQGIRETQNKVQLYDQAMQDPVGTIRQLASQHGLTVVNGQAPQQETGQQFKPESWDDVYSHIRNQVMEEMSSAYQPLVGEVRDLKKKNVEQYMDSKFTDWRTYEPEMIDNLQKHPSLAQDPDTLYRLSVPQEVIEARATERALKKLRGETSAATVSGPSNTTQVTSERPKGKMSFDDAVKFAKSKLRQQGLTAPSA